MIFLCHVNVPCALRLECADDTLQACAHDRNCLSGVRNGVFGGVDEALREVKGAFYGSKKY